MIVLNGCNSDRVWIGYDSTMWRTRARGRDPVCTGDEAPRNADRAATPDGQREAAGTVDSAPCPQVCQR